MTVTVLKPIYFSADQVPDRLLVSHQIFLTGEQRRALTKPESDVQVTGISVPVWVRGKETTEPAQEVFCNYRLTTMFEHPRQIISNADGYWINLDISKWNNLLD